MQTATNDTYIKIKNRITNYFKKHLKNDIIIMWFFDEGVYVFKKSYKKITREIFIPKSFYSLDYDAITLLEDNGFYEKNIYIIGNAGRIRISKNNYPKLDQKKLKETIQWDGYVLSNEETTYTTTYRIEKENYENRTLSVYVAFCPENEYEMMTETANREGKSILGIIPSYEIGLTADENTVFLYQDGENLKLIKGKSVSRKRNFKIDALDVKDFENKKIRLLRTNTTEISDSEKVLKILGENAESDINEKTLTKFINELESVQMCFNVNKSKFKISKEKTIQRLTQLFFILSLIMFFHTLATFTREYVNYSKEKTRYEELAPTRKEKEKHDEYLTKIHEKYEKIEEIQKEKSYGEEFLINLAEAVNENAILTEIETNGDTVRINGIAKSGEELSKIRKNLKTMFKEVKLEKATTKGKIVNFQIICGENKK